MTDKPSSQSVVSIIIVVAALCIALGALLLAYFDKSQTAAALTIAGTVAGGLLSALQTPGSLSNAIGKILPAKTEEVAK